MRRSSPVYTLATTTVDPSTATRSVWGVKTTPLREEPRVERHDRRDPDVLSRVEEAGDHLDPAAALEEVVGGREPLLGVDVVHHDHALPDLDAVQEDVAIRHDVLAVEPRERRDVRVRAGRDDHDVGRLGQHALDVGLGRQPAVDALPLHLAHQEPHDPGVVRAGGRAGGDEHLPAELAPLLEEHHAVAAERGDPRGLEAAHAAADHDDPLLRGRPPDVSELRLAPGARDSGCR